MFYARKLKVNSNPKCFTENLHSFILILINLTAQQLDDLSFKVSLFDYVCQLQGNPSPVTRMTGVLKETHALSFLHGTLLAKLSA